MNTFEFTFLVWIGSFGAGLLGSLTGLGGGVVLVPLLSIVFHVDIRYAIGASLVSVIATSSGAAAAYVREGYSNLRVGMFLEIATVVGAICGALIAGRVSTSLVAIIFGVVLLYSAYASWAGKSGDKEKTAPNRLAQRLRLDSNYPSDGGVVEYHVTGVPGGFALMYVAGVLSGLLGIGSGAIKVLAMDRVMKLPFKVSTTTSNFMIGVTAAASAGIYLSRGYIEPGLAMPVMLGVLPGALLGAKVLMRAQVKTLRAVFSVIIVVMALEMLYKGISGKL